MPSVAPKRARNGTRKEGESSKTAEMVGQQTKPRSGAELAVALQTTSFDVLRVALTELRSETSVYSGERIDASDERIVVAREFIREQGAVRIRDALFRAEEVQQTALLSVALRSIANLINVLGAHQPNHADAEDLLAFLLPLKDHHGVEGEERRQSGSFWPKLEVYLSEANAAPSERHNSAGGRLNGQKAKASSDESLTSVLTVLLALTTFAGAKYARIVFDAIPWGMRSLSRLLSMRRRSNQRAKRDQSSIVTLARPDIRTLWTLVLLSFLRTPTGACTPVTLRIAALTLGRDLYAGILKGLSRDPALIVTHILTGLHDGLLSDEASLKLPRARVVGLFNEWACKELVNLYEREEDLVKLVQSDEEHSISDVAHHFLLALCTHPGRGVCYMDNGWYGKLKEGVDVDEEAAEQQKSVTASMAIHNKILLGILRSLAVSRSAKQAELALRILAASSELVAPYLATFTNLEPKAASISWLANSTFLGRTLSLPLPTFKNVLPPSSAICMDSLIPAPLTKPLFIRGIQQSDRLMRLCTVSLLARVLCRLLHFKQVCKEMRSNVSSSEAPIDDPSIVLKEDVLSGSFGMMANKVDAWEACWSTILPVVQERLPDVSALLNSVELASSSPVGGGSSAVDATRAGQHCVLLEQTLRCCWLLQELLEGSISLSTNELDKLFRYAAPDARETSAFSSNARLQAIRTIASFASSQGSALDLFTRSTGSVHTYFSRLLRLSFESHILQESTFDLLGAAMKSTVLFEHDQEEWQAWHYALTFVRSHDILDFLDECCQRCLKTPYRYIELVRSRSNAMDLYASPLLATMVEQYCIRLRKGLLQDCQVFVSFLARLIPALIVGGRPIESLKSVVDDCQKAAKESDGEKSIDAITSLLELAEILQGLTSTRDDQRDNGIASEGSAEDAGMVSPFAFATNLTHRSQDYQKIEWKDTSNVEAKFVVLAIVRTVVHTKKERSALVPKLLDALEQSPFDPEFFSTVVAAELLKGDCLLDSLADIVTRGPIDEGDHAVRQAVSPLIERSLELAEKNESDSRFWQLALSLVPFMELAGKQQLVQSLSLYMPEGLLEMIGSDGNGVLISDTDVVQLMKASGSTASIIELLCSSQQSSAARELVPKDKDRLIGYLVQHASERNADTALSGFLDRHKEECVVFLRALEASEDLISLLGFLPSSLARACRYERGQVSELLVEACSSLFFEVEDGDRRRHLAFALHEMMKRDSSNVVLRLQTRLPDQARKVFRKEALLLAAGLESNDVAQRRFIQDVVERSLLWLVRRFAEDDEDTSETMDGLEGFETLLKLHGNILARLGHLVEPVLTASIRRRLAFGQPYAELTRSLLVHTDLETSARQRYFDEALRNRTALADSSVSLCLISALTSCTSKDANVMTGSLMAAMVPWYTGSLTLQDRKIFELFYTFERRTGTSITSVLRSSWTGGGQSERVAVQDDQLVWRLDANRILETCLRFPRFRCFTDIKRNGYEDEGESNNNNDDGEGRTSVYDPLLLLGIVGQYVSRERGPTGLELIELLRTNLVGCAVCALSSRSAVVRKISVSLLAKTYAYISSAQFHEREQVLLLFDVLRAQALDEQPLPLTTTLFVAHALRAQAQPSLYLYPLISRFLLQRAMPLDKTDVPLLYGFLFASSHQSQTFRQERMFIIRFLAACLRYGGRTEWRIMQRRHVWHSLCSLYSTVLLRGGGGGGGGEGQSTERRAIEDVFQAAARKPYAALSVVNRFGFLAFLVQTFTVRRPPQSMTERKHWTRMLCSLLVALDLERVRNPKWLCQSVCILFEKVQQSDGELEGGASPVEVLSTPSLLEFVQALHRLRAVQSSSFSTQQADLLILCKRIGHALKQSPADPTSVDARIREEVVNVISTLLATFDDEEEEAQTLSKELSSRTESAHDPSLKVYSTPTRRA